MFRKLEDKISGLVLSINGLSKVDVENIMEYLYYGEYGLAFDILCTQLYEYELKLSKDEYDKIEQIGRSLKLDDSNWDYLQELLEQSFSAKNV